MIVFSDLKQRCKVNTLTENLNGNCIRNQIGEKNPSTLGDRMWDLNISLGRSTYGPTARSMENMEIVKAELEAYTTMYRKLNDKANTLANEIANQGGPLIQGVDFTNE